MITLPNKEVPFIAQDLLKVFAEALFIEYKDNRLISLIDNTTVETRVALIRSSSVFTDLISALDLFGEVDVLKLLSPKILIFANEISLGIDFNEALESNFKVLI